MPPVCELADKLRFKLEKKEDELSLGRAGVYGSFSSAIASSPLVAGGVDGPRFEGWVGVGEGRSGVVDGENLELRLFIHDDLFDPFSDPDRSRPKIPGRFDSVDLLDAGAAE